MDVFPCDFYCAAVMQLHVTTRDNPNRHRLSLFMDATLLICEWNLIWNGSKGLANEQRRIPGGDYPRLGMMSSATDGRFANQTARFARSASAEAEHFDGQPGSGSVAHTFHALAKRVQENGALAFGVR